MAGDDGFVIVIGLIIVLIFVGIFIGQGMNGEYIDATGEYFCQDYGLTYDGYEIEPNELGKRMIWFICKNETIEKVDTIGIMKIGGDV